MNTKRYWVYKGKKMIGAVTVSPMKAKALAQKGFELRLVSGIG